MKILLHTCCAPCLLFPYREIERMSSTCDITVYFHNPNIHPFKEFKNRMDCLVLYLKKKGIPAIIDKNYGLKEFVRKVAFNEEKKCSICYDMRLYEVARFAGLNGFDFFSTTLLYSKYQNHSLIVSIAEKYASQYNIRFLNEDFRRGWQEGIDDSISLGLYRQSYCGCIYSEQERYDNRLKKQLRKLKKMKG